MISAAVLGYAIQYLRNSLGTEVQETVLSFARGSSTQIRTCNADLSFTGESWDLSLGFFQI